MLALSLSVLVSVAGAIVQPDPVWDSVAAILKAPPAPITAYHRFGFPRTDLTVKVGDVTVATGLALGGWVGFSGPADDAAVIGDLVVRPDEAAGVTNILMGRSVTVTAIHNHLTGESPEVVYLHFVGEGPALDLARTIDAAIATTATPRGIKPGPPAPPVLDTAAVFNGLGLRGRAAGAVINLTAQLIQVPIRVGHHDLPAALAAASPINLQAVSAGRVVATGDFALTGAVAPAVLLALRAAGIAVTAIHSHFITSAPSLVYIHFWADGPLATVVTGLGAVLDAARS